MANNAPAVQNGNDVASLIKSQMPAIKMAMSGASDEERKKRAERFCRVALTAIRNNNDLMKADPMSLMGALMTSASLNLEIDPRGLAYLVPYKGEIQLQIGYKGLKELAYRTGKVKSIYDEVVYKNEVDAGKVVVTIGLERDLKHIIDVTNPELRQESKDNPIVLAYAVAVLHDDSRHFEFVDASEVAKRKKSSQSANGKYPQYSPWNTWEAEMWKKTAVKKLARALPQATEYADFQRAVALDEQADAGVHQQLNAIDIEPTTKPRDISAALDAAEEQQADTGSNVREEAERRRQDTFAHIEQLGLSVDAVHAEMRVSKSPTSWGKAECAKAVEVADAMAAEFQADAAREEQGD